MRITVLTQLAKGLRVPPELSATLAAQLQPVSYTHLTLPTKA